MSISEFIENIRSKYLHDHGVSGGESRSDFPGPHQDCVEKDGMSERCKV